MKTGMQTVVVAGGCFWGLEELLRMQPGVVDTEVGYAGGTKPNPTYENHTGYAEAVEIRYDPTRTTLDTLLDYFFSIHDPTTINRQGNDRGTSYRSTLFYQDSLQKTAMTRAIERNQVYWSQPICTTLEPLTQFWVAEAYHQDYLQKNPGGYSCHYERPRRYE